MNRDLHLGYQKVTNGRSWYSICWVVPPPSNCGKWRFIGIPDPKNVIILVVTITGRGDNPKYLFFTSETNIFFYSENQVGPAPSNPWIELRRLNRSVRCRYLGVRRRSSWTLVGTTKTSQRVRRGPISLVTLCLWTYLLLSHWINPYRYHSTNPRQFSFTPLLSFHKNPPPPPKKKQKKHPGLTNSGFQKTVARHHGSSSSINSQFRQLIQGPFRLGDLGRLRCASLFCVVFPIRWNGDD